MEGTAVLGRLTWQVGNVVESVAETPRVRTLTLDLPDWPGHRAGQHADVRLTAEDGYQAVRSYSIASPPEEKRVMLTVERLDDGEVSPYLVDEVRVGDQMEIRGPIGGYFVWETEQGGPLILVVGGSGIVPLRAMLRHAIASESDTPIRLLYSSRSPGETLYRVELDRFEADQNQIEIVYTYTRSSPPGWKGYTRRIDEAMLQEVGWAAGRHPLVYVCGPTSFVEAAASSLLGLGNDPARIRTERFGPTGG
jgi:ferredoxin-NADP reductase